MPELDDFLGAEPEEEKPVIETPEVAAEVAPEVEEPEVEVAPEPEPAAKPEPTEPAEPGDVTGLKSALQAERAKRNDYKGERDRLAGELAAIKAQLDAAVKPAPTAPAAPAVPATIPNPVEDPQGYHAHIQQMIFNDKLHMSEVMLRQQVGNNDDVTAKAAKFKEMASANHVLRAELQKSAHPWKFAYDTASKAMALDEIGDPAAYRTKLEAEIRASVMAEMAGAAPAAAPRVVLPQSLGTARSAASRNVPVINVPESFDDILRVEKR